MQDAGVNVKKPFSRIVQQFERGLKVVLVEPWVPVNISKVVVVGEAGTAWLMVKHLTRNQSLKLLLLALVLLVSRWTFLT